MSLLEKIPAMSDIEVANLLANARRLGESGDPKQQAAAQELLPALEAEATARAAVKAEAAAEKRAVAVKKRKATTAAVVEEDAEAA